MLSFGEKVRSRRLTLGITQSDLAKHLGVSERTIYSYEHHGTAPRRDLLRHLAQVLEVSVAYLVDDNVNDPQQGMDQDLFLAATRQEFGVRGVREAELLLQRVSALFAGGELDDAAKDIFFQDITAAYLEVKQEARRKFAPRRARRRSE
ncbi:MAG: helix-turn-helix domain-containing protein [Symbiobacteriaceae bacterium]|nr:helix-turn-helix domain-containing protein [Symbiobacteriaceae bacterium]